MTIRNKLGYAVSFSKILEIETTIANSKLSSSTTLILNDNHQNIPNTAIYDNIDRLEETLCEYGTTYKVNGILVQQAFISPLLSPAISRMEKTETRNIEVPQRVLPTYNAGRKTEVPVLSCPDQRLSIEGIQVQLIHFIWALTQYLKRDVQTVSSWTGFSMLRRRNKQVQKDTVDYLRTIEVYATQMSIIFEILNNANSIKNTLNLKSMVVVMDQTTYPEAIEISWKHQDLFKI